ncbi:hypothetical protein TIFTF001_020461 [Ficus carica]|uniref:Uncharacterized protein n=1 Tax=Ficus carica TaxID=3494 RepID=A0AA88DJL6_FICCA|nr:hypothetical protein TIFTF001_020461 [Ficus carica]
MEEHPWCDGNGGMGNGRRQFRSGFTHPKSFPPAASVSNHSGNSLLRTTLAILFLIFQPLRLPPLPHRLRPDLHLPSQIRISSRLSAQAPRLAPPSKPHVAVTHTLLSSQTPAIKATENRDGFVRPTTHRHCRRAHAPNGFVARGRGGSVARGRGGEGARRLDGSVVGSRRRGMARAWRSLGTISPTLDDAMSHVLDVETMTCQSLIPLPCGTASWFPSGAFSMWMVCKLRL